MEDGGLVRRGAPSGRRTGSACTARSEQRGEKIAKPARARVGFNHYASGVCVVIPWDGLYHSWRCIMAQIKEPERSKQTKASLGSGEGSIGHD